MGFIFKMVGSSSDDSNDSEFQCSKITPKLAEAHKEGKFYDEEWPNSLPSESRTTSERVPQPCVENILKMIREQTRAKSGQNGRTEIVPAERIAEISRKIDKQELERIIGSVQQPKAHSKTVQHPPLPVQPPPPQVTLPPPPPQHQPVQHPNIVSRL